MAIEIACPYCGSTDTTDCGEIDTGAHHFECHGCRCGFTRFVRACGTVHLGSCSGEEV